MKTLLKTVLVALLLGGPCLLVVAQEDGADQAPTEDAAPAAATAPEPLPEDYSCMFCHGSDGTLAGDEETKHLIVTAEDLGEDVHWQKGIRCHDCHGGNPALDNYVDHRDDDGFHPLASPAEIPEFCGRCHSDGKYMQRFQPSPKTDQFQQYTAGVHGQHLSKNAEDPEGANAATCLSCHSKAGKHDIVAVQDNRSPMHVRSQVKTCGGCHEKDKTAYLESVHHGSGGEVGAACADCHGTHDIYPATDERSRLYPVRVVTTCGECHADIQHMRKFRPAPRTDQLTEYLTSGHGKKLMEDKDLEVATCVSCHCLKEHQGHRILAVNDMESPVYPTNLAETCKQCHGNVQIMAGRQYNEKPLGHDQYDKWKGSVHAKALLEKGDLSAPTCNDCHGNHGAVPPDVDSVANTCGSCHVKVASLFAETIMKHRFERTDWGGLPGCTACHGNHEIQHPTDEMLGMTKGAVCVECHQKDEDGPVFAAVDAGAEAARQMRKGLEELNRQIETARETLNKAKRLGMEVRKPLFELREADDALTNARSLVHGFAPEPMKETLDQGMEIAKAKQQRAEEALGDYTERRILLALFLVPIAITVGLLLLYIRSHPPVEL